MVLNFAKRAHNGKYRILFISIYHCNLVTHNFELSNEKSSRIVYDVDVIYYTISEQNHFTAELWEVKSLKISFPPHFRKPT